MLKAWAWGVSKAIDYFETDKAVDAKQIGLEGHSRYGKATLVAMAYEPRLAIALCQLVGRGRGKALPAHLRRAGGQRGRDQRVPLDGREFSEICRAADAGRHASGCARADCDVRAAAGVHFRWGYERRRLGGRQGNVSGRRGRGAGIQAAGQAGHRDHRVSADGDLRSGRRYCVPAALGRAYAGPELADIYRFCGAVSARGEAQARATAESGGAGKRQSRIIST